MRIDIVSIFPDYFAALEVSLLGKANAAGLVDLNVHDLRAWAHDKHRSVDDTPYGGGAGMVMKPDVWGAALDEVAADALIIIPSPAGHLFTQDTAAELAGAEHLVFACGRYEGIDGRVGEHFAERVRYLSLGDYVLNGGEVAALAMIEAITRLIPGFLGNDESLTEESHAAGLLEYPAYTKPATWRGVPVPNVLRSGDHAQIRQWRRAQSLLLTATRRPDLIERLPVAHLDRFDREVLARAGFLWHTGTARPVPVQIRPAVSADVSALARLAARTFPRACPPQIPAADVTRFIEENLRADQWEQRLATPAGNLIHVAETGGDLVGYTWVKLPATADTPPADPDIAAVVRARPAAELSKVYVDAHVTGTGLAGALLEVAIDATRPHAAALWLGTNSGNRPARALYKRHGMRKVGKRTFYVGDVRNDDVVYLIELP